MLLAGEASTQRTPQCASTYKYVACHVDRARMQFVNVLRLFVDDVNEINRLMVRVR